MRYVLTGGGTGGHVYPNLAIAGELAGRDKQAQFLYLGVRGRAEADIVPRYGIPIRFVPARGLPERRYSPAMVMFLFAFLLGTFKALLVLLRFRPDLVIATGGYASAPALFAARLLKRPIIVHEQNAYPGLVNRTFGRMANRVCLTFPESLHYFEHNGVLAGYPVRPEILALRKPVADEEKRRLKAELGVDPQRAVLLITGGSLGARSINRAVADMMPLVAQDPHWRERLLVVHGVGRYDSKEYHAEQDTASRLATNGFDERANARFYHREKYIYDIAKWLRVADAVVCRAGAGSLAETAASGVPAVVIPKAGLPGDHQVKNAEAMRATGAAVVLREHRAVEDSEAYDAVDAASLWEALRGLLSADAEQKEKMAKAAWQFVATDCLPRIHREAEQVLAGPPETKERVRRRRTYLVDEKGDRIELLFDRSRVGSGQWDDIRPAVPGLARKHFWLKRSAREINGRTEETWTVMPRAELRLRRAGKTEPEELSGPTKLADGDHLVFPHGGAVSLAHEWIEVSRVKSEKGAVENIFSQGVGTMAAKLVGLLREAFLGRFFGAGNIMDMFAVALMLANLMREVVAEMALENAFLPSFRLFYARSEDKKSAWRLAWQVFNLFFLLSAGIAVLGVLTCPWWIGLVAPGFVEKGLLGQTTALTRLMFPFLVLMSISAFLGTLLQSFDRFGPNAFSPVLYSLGLIFSVAALHGPLGVYSLGVGVLLGGALQVIFQFVFLLRRGMREKVAWSAYRPIVKPEPGVKKVVALSGPVFMDAMLNKISGVVDKVLATVLVAGSVSALYFSRLLIVMPFSVLAMSVSRVFLRDLSDVAAGGDVRRYRDTLQRGIDASIFLMVPTTVALIALATPLVRVIFEGGAFSAGNTQMTSLALICYAIGLVGWSLTALYSRVFSSQLDTRTSLITSAGSLAVYLVFALILVRTPLAHAGLALATSIGFLFNMVWRHLIIARRLAAEGAPLPLSRLMPTFGKTVVASAVSVLVIVLLYVDPGAGRGFWVNAWSFGVPMIVGIVVFLAFTYLLRTRPLIDLLNHMTARWGLGRPFGQEPVRQAEGNGNVHTMTAAGLLAEAQRRQFSAEEAAVARQRLEGWLGHDDWWIRNIGIKLIGALRLTGKTDFLADAIVGKSPRPWWRRWLLGEGREVGFIRRNAIASLIQIGQYDEHVRRVLLAALGDDYYEARQYALRAVGFFVEQCRGDKEIVAAVARNLRDRHFEVVPMAAKAYAEISDDQDALSRLQPLLQDPRWPVRAAAAEACRRLYDRGVIVDRAVLRRVLSETLLASEMVEPVSPLKQAIKDAIEGLEIEED